MDLGITRAWGRKTFQCYLSLQSFDVLGAEGRDLGVWGLRFFFLNAFFHLASMPVGKIHLVESELDNPEPSVGHHHSAPISDSCPSTSSPRTRPSQACPFPTL